MRVTVEYLGPARELAETESEAFDLSAGSSVAEVLKLAADRHPRLCTLLLPEGIPSRTLLLALNERQVDQPARQTVAEGDVLTIIPPVSGGEA